MTAPELKDWGIGFGYSGNGCHTLIRLVDITAPAARHSDPEAPRTLFVLLRDTPSNGTTTYTRAQLLAVRAGGPHPRRTLPRGNGRTLPGPDGASHRDSVRRTVPAPRSPLPWPCYGSRCP